MCFQPPPGQGISDHKLYEALRDASLLNPVDAHTRAALRARFDFLLERRAARERGRNNERVGVQHNSLLASTLSVDEFLAQPEFGHHPLARRYIETLVHARKTEDTSSEKSIEDESGQSVTLRLNPDVAGEHGITFFGATDTAGGGGAKVTFVAPGSLAQASGIRANDLLTGVTTFVHGHGTFLSVANMPWKKARKIAEQKASRTLSFLRKDGGKGQGKKKLLAATRTLTKKRRGSRLARTQSHKSPNFYGVTFSALGSIGLTLVQDPAHVNNKNATGCVVGKVVHGGAASINGKVQASDALVSVNGKSTADMRLPKIIQYIGKAPRPLNLRFHRAHGSGRFGGDGSRDFRYTVRFGNGRIGLGLKERKAQRSRMQSYYGGMAPVPVADSAQAEIEEAASKVGKVFVSEVVPGTQASQGKTFFAGPIQIGDVLVAINNRDVSAMSQKATMNVLSQEGRPVFCQFVRPAKKDRNLLSRTTAATAEDRAGGGYGETNARQSGVVVSGDGVETGYPVGMSGAFLVHSEWTKHASYRVSFEDVLAAFAVACHETDATVRDAVVFRMFDVDGDGIVTYDDLFYIFKMTSQGRLTDIKLEILVNKVLDKFDATHDGELDTVELRKLVDVDTLLAMFHRH
jgi:C-terminal processing protease CtpA/Prc